MDLHRIRYVREGKPSERVRDVLPRVLSPAGYSQAAGIIVKKLKRPYLRGDKVVNRLWRESRPAVARGASPRLNAKYRRHPTFFTSH